MSSSSPAPDRVYQRKEGLLTASVNDEMLMMSAELGQYFNLNPVGSRIWAMLEAPKTLAELVAALGAEYDATADVIRAEAKDFLVRLEKEGLLMAPDRTRS